jgi:hypothetical protein
MKPADRTAATRAKRTQTCDLSYVFTKTVWHNCGRTAFIMFDLGRRERNRAAQVLKMNLRRESPLNLILPGR